MKNLIIFYPDGNSLYLHGDHVQYEHAGLSIRYNFPHDEELTTSQWLDFCFDFNDMTKEDTENERKKENFRLTKGIR